LLTRKNLRSEIDKLTSMLSRLEVPDDSGELLPSANGIDRIIFQARFLIRALKSDPVRLAPIIEATKKSMIANLRNRPELALCSEVVAVLKG
jgi:hypothetical protein